MKDALNNNKNIQLPGGKDKMGWSVFGYQATIMLMILQHNHTY